MVRDKAGAGSAGGGLARVQIQEASASAGRASSRDSIHINALESIVRHRQIWAAKIQKQMEVLQESYPDVLRAVETRHVANLVLLKQLKVVSHLREHGELSEMDAGVLVDDINKQRKAIHYARAHALGNKSMKETLLEVPAFAFLGAKIATDESEMRSNDVKGHKWQKDCKTLLDDIIDHVKEKAYNVDEIVTGPSLLEKGSAEEPSTTGAAAASAKPGTSPDAKPGRRRRSVAEVIAVAAVNASHALDGTSKGSKGGDSPEGGRVEQTNLATSAGAKTGRRGSIFGAKKEKPAEAQRSRSTALHEVYDQLIIVKRGQLMVGQPKGAEHSRGSAISAVMIDEGTGADGGFGAEEVTAGSYLGRKVGPSQITGLACVLQQVNLEKLDQENKLPPTVRCTRSAEVLVVSGRSVREAINKNDVAGQDLRRELWCMYAKEVGMRTLRLREPFTTWPEAVLAQHIERGWLLEWDEEHDEIELLMERHVGILVTGSCFTLDDGGRSSGSSDNFNASDWKPAGAILRPGERVAIQQDDPMLSPLESAAAANMAMAMGGLHPGLPGLAPPPQRDNSAGSSGAAAPIIKQTSSISQQRMRAHKSIRVLCLPVQDSMRLHMEAPHVYSISNDTSVRRFEGPRGSVARLSRSADLRKSVGAQSKKNLLGKDAVAGSSKRLFDMFNRGTGKDKGGISVRANPDGLMSVKKNSMDAIDEAEIEVVTSQ